MDLDKIIREIIRHCEAKSEHYARQIPDDYDDQERPDRIACEAYGSTYTALEIRDFVRKLAGEP